ncbi:MAG: HhH-GPD-type base excision DNA repair protein [Acidimicrobiia bacterium]
MAPTTTASRKKKVAIPITGDAEADQFLVDDPLALLIGMLLDQQVPMEWAFRGPSTLRTRLGHLDAGKIAAMSPEDLEAVFKEKPALHRYPGSMAKRTHALCVAVVDDYGGDAAKIWKGTKDPAKVYANIRALPGYGEEKAKIFYAILGKRLRVAPKGWEEYAAPFSDEQPRSVADIDSREAFAEVRAWKQAKKAAGKTKQD